MRVRLLACFKVHARELNKGGHDVAARIIDLFETFLRRILLFCKLDYPEAGASNSLR